jgi:heme/copper-type cytochrome/quinol oxidase subunit 2
MRLKRFANLLLFSIAATAVAATQTSGCPMCKASVANAENSDEISATINTAILILLAPTLALIGVLVKLAFKYRHYVNFTTSGSERDTQQRQRDPAHHGLPLHSSEKDQGPPGFDD